MHENHKMVFNSEYTTWRTTGNQHIIYFFQRRFHQKLKFGRCTSRTRNRTGEPLGPGIPGGPAMPDAPWKENQTFDNR